MNKQNRLTLLPNALSKWSKTERQTNWMTGSKKLLKLGPYDKRRSGPRLVCSGTIKPSRLGCPWSGVMDNWTDDEEHQVHEGQINRLKLIKRQTYGRVKLDLLKK